MKWEIRVEPCDGGAFAFVPGTGQIDDVPIATRVRFRPAGSRGRFRSFVMEGAPDLSQDEQQELIDKVVASGDFR